MEGSYGSIGPGGLGMPTGGISELGGGLGNGSSLPGLSSLGGGALEGPGGSFGEQGSTVLVRDLPDGFSQVDLQTAFAQFGKIVFCDVGEGNSGRVGFESRGDANNAVATMNGIPCGAKTLHVSVRAPRPAALRDDANPLPRTAPPHAPATLP